MVAKDTFYLVLPPAFHQDADLGQRVILAGTEVENEIAAFAVTAPFVRADLVPGYETVSRDTVFMQCRTGAYPQDVAYYCAGQQPQRQRGWHCYQPNQHERTARHTRGVDELPPPRRRRFSQSLNQPSAPSPDAPRQR